MPLEHSYWFEAKSEIHETLQLPGKVAEYITFSCFFSEISAINVSIYAFFVLGPIPAQEGVLNFFLLH